MLFEIAGIGILVPALSILLDPNELKSVEIRNFIIIIFGNLSHAQFVILGLSTIIVFYLIKSGFLIYLAFRQSRFATTLTVDLSLKLFKGYLNMPYFFHLKNSSTQLQKNIQIEILHFGGICLAAMVLSTEVTAIIGIALFLIFMEPLGAISVIIFFLFFSFVFNKLTSQKIKNWGYQRQDSDNKSVKLLNEGLAGIKQVKLSSIENFYINKFSKYETKKASLNTRIQVLAIVPRLYLELLAIIGVSILIFSMLLQSKPVSQLIPILGVFVASAFRMIPSINRVMNSLQTIAFAQSVIDVLVEQFDVIKSHLLKSDKKLKIKFENGVTVKNLNFKYSGSNKMTLNNIDFIIKKGDFIGFVGVSGSGKSTLIDNIVGLLEPSSGEISVDGININSNISMWQSTIGYVPQTIFLIDDSLRRNIALGIPDNDIDEKKISDAIKSAQLISVINKLSDGLDTIVGERGVRISGGERQRIGIARALYNDPDLLILDEATSSLDNETESDFMEAINALKGKKTILLVAHRLSTIRNCDKIYNLKNGMLHLNNDFAN
jgi:ABC-type multidrug transport system fused ATPase/permease subunit